MKKRPIALLMVLCILLSLTGTAWAAGADDIVVLYNNDVHCNVDGNIGYAGLAAYEAEMEGTYGADRVTLVDAGDAVQGAALGTLSEGEYIVRIMNEVGYDIFTLGNHEFDYGMDRMYELTDMLDAAVVSCNFVSLATGEAVFEPYEIIDYGNIQVAYVGIATPKTFTSSTPKYFQDDSGNYIYSFCEDDTGEALYGVVQESVDAAIAEGADVVVAVGHCGVGDDLVPWQSTDIIAHTTGIDAFIDGHSHSTIAGDVYQNENGEDVVLTSTGSGLASIGKMVISADGTVTTERISDYTEKDADVDTFVKEIQTENEELLNSVVAETEVALVVNDPDTGTRLIRNSETNLGDIAADAYRDLTGADIAVVNGGGIRADIAAGDITYGDIIAVHPFGNSACLVEATGQEILDMLEMGARKTPAENGGFLQVSGLTYEIHTYVASSVTIDDKGNFVSVDGEYRVKNVEINGEPLDLNQTYTMASHNYLIKLGGDGFTMFLDNNLLLDEVMIDNQVLITYIVDTLGGVVGTNYAATYGEGRINIYETPFTDIPTDGWYYNSVVYVYGEGIMKGIPGGGFSPDLSMSRAMFVTTLYRLAGSPEVAGSASALFNDCDDGIWYSDAVVWAVGNEITDGVSDAAFDPGSSLSRQEMAVFLYRYIRSRDSGFEGGGDALSFTDSDQVAEWAVDAVSYCAMNGFVTGMPSGAFDPEGAASRAMGATVLERFCTAAAPAA